jgi:hypothetical protein
MAKQKPVILPDYKADSQDDIEALIARNRQLEDDFDPMYIPGYTEIQKANAIAEVDDLLWRDAHPGQPKEYYYNQLGKNPQPLPVHFQAVRVAGMDGTHNANVTRDKAEYDRWGYRPAKYPEDFTPHGFGQPVFYVVQADGTLRREDLQLFVVDARAARARELSIARRTAEMENPESKDGEGTSFTGTAEKRFEHITT